MVVIYEIVTTCRRDCLELMVFYGDGRKKDFWDIHFLLTKFSMDEMLLFHQRRHPWEHDRTKLMKDLMDFRKADKDPNPRCLLGKD